MPGQNQPVDVIKNLASDMGGKPTGKFESSYKKMMMRFAQATYNVSRQEVREMAKLERDMTQLKTEVVREIPKGTLTQYMIDMKVILDRLPKVPYSQFDQSCRSYFPEIEERELEWDQLEKNINDQIRTMQHSKTTKTSVADLKKAYANLSDKTTKYIKNVEHLLANLDILRNKMIKHLMPQDKKDIKIGEISRPENP